jgi:hypothetical protein
MTWQEQNNSADIKGNGYQAIQLYNIFTTVAGMIDVTEFKNRENRGGLTERDTIGDQACTANERPVRIQYICPVPIYVFPEMKVFFQNIIVMCCLPGTTLVYL